MVDADAVRRDQAKVPAGRRAASVVDPAPAAPFQTGSQQQCHGLTPKKAVQTGALWVKFCSGVLKLENPLSLTLFVMDSTCRRAFNDGVSCRSQACRRPDWLGQGVSISGYLFALIFVEFDKKLSSVAVVKIFSFHVCGFCAAESAVQSRLHREKSCGEFILPSNKEILHYMIDSISIVPSE